MYLYIIIIIYFITIYQKMFHYCYCYGMSRYKIQLKKIVSSKASNDCLQIIINSHFMGWIFLTQRSCKGTTAGLEMVGTWNIHYFAVHARPGNIMFENHNHCSEMMKNSAVTKLVLHWTCLCINYSGF